jgi:hypothetical protein
MEVSIGKVIGKCGKIHHKSNKWRGAKSKKITVNGIFSRGFLLSSIVTGQSNPQNPQISSAKAPVLLKGRAAPGFLFSSFDQQMCRVHPNNGGCGGFQSHWANPQSSSRHWTMT